EGECSTRRLGDSTSDDCDINVSETDFSDMNHEEKQESDKRKQSESDQIQTNKNEDNPAPAINPIDLPTLINQGQLSTLTVTNPIIQTPGTPPPRPNVNDMQVTPQKSVLFKESVTYLQNHIKIDVNDQGMIIKDNHTYEEISAIQSVYNEYKFHWIEVELDCKREVKQIFPKFDLPINQADGLGMRNSSNKAIVFIEVLGGPENTDQKKLKEDSEKLLKEAVFGLVSLLRNYLDKSAEESKQLYTFIIQGIGNLFSELEIQTGVINKLRLSESVDGVIVPRIRDWIWLPDSISAWKCE
ncbi:6668_t:CDS:2, partial [Acaulospora colombiana]